MRETFSKLGGNEVSVWQKEGVETRAVFFCIHGVGGGSKDFKMIAEKLVDDDGGRRVVGIGLNRTPGGKAASIKGYGRQVAHVMRVLGKEGTVNSKYYVIAHSMGTAIWLSGTYFADEVAHSFLLAPPPLGQVLLPPKSMLRYAPIFLKDFLRPSGGLFTMPEDVLGQFLTNDLRPEVSLRIKEGFHPESKRAFMETALGLYGVSEEKLSRSSIAVGLEDKLVRGLPVSPDHKDLEFFKFGHMAPLFSNKGSTEIVRWIDSKV